MNRYQSILSACVLSYASMALAALDPNQHLLLLPIGSQLISTQKLEIRASLRYTVLEETDTHTCFLGSFKTPPKPHSPPDFNPDADTRTFPVGTKFKVISRSGFRTPKRFQGLRIELQASNAPTIKYMIYLEQTGAEMGFTSLADGLTACGNKLKLLE